MALEGFFTVYLDTKADSSFTGNLLDLGALGVLKSDNIFAACEVKRLSS